MRGRHGVYALAAMVWLTPSWSYDLVVLHPLDETIVAATPRPSGHADHRTARNRHRILHIVNHATRHAIPHARVGASRSQPRESRDDRCRNHCPVPGRPRHVGALFNSVRARELALVEHRHRPHLPRGNSMTELSDLEWSLVRHALAMRIGELNKIAKPSPRKMREAARMAAALSELKAKLK